MGQGASQHNLLQAANQPTHRHTHTHTHIYLELFITGKWGGAWAILCAHRSNFGGLPIIPTTGQGALSRTHARRSLNGNIKRLHGKGNCSPSPTAGRQWLSNPKTLSRAVAGSSWLASNPSHAALAAAQPQHVAHPCAGGHAMPPSADSAFDRQEVQ